MFEISLFDSQTSPNLYIDYDKNLVMSISIVDLHVGVGNCLHFSALRMLLQIKRLAPPTTAIIEQSTKKRELTPPILYESCPYRIQ